MRQLDALLTVALALAFVLTGCDNAVPDPEKAPDAPTAVSQGPGLDPGPYNFSASVFGIDATSNGSILIAETPPIGSDQSTTTIKEIRKQGVQDVTEFSHVQGVPINGLAVQGRGSIFAAHGGGDLAVGAGLWHVSPGNTYFRNAYAALGGSPANR